MRLLIHIMLLIYLFSSSLVFASEVISFNKLGSSDDKINTKKNIYEIFILEKIFITGNKKTSKKDILDILPAPGNDNLFNLKLAKIKTNLLSFPWVKNVEVRRILPGTLYLRIFEYIPFVVWQNKGTFKLLDEDGLVITSVDYPNSKLPLVIGESAPKNISSFFKALYFHPELKNNLMVASNYRGRRWDITLESGIIIKLPEKGVKKALIKLSELDKNNNLLDKDIKIIDLRIEDRLFITLREGSKIKFNKDTFNGQNV